MEGRGHIEAPMEGSYRGSNGGGHIEAPMEGSYRGPNGGVI